jgi:hypothetical protein
MKNTYTQRIKGLKDAPDKHRVLYQKRRDSLIDIPKPNKVTTKNFKVVNVVKQ